MLVSEFNDEKSTAYGAPIASANGVPIHRCMRMIYWFRWGDHVFDIRVMWNLLGLQPCEPFITKVTNDSISRKWRPNPNFLSTFITAIEDQDFPSLIEAHDADINHPENLEWMTP